MRIAGYLVVGEKALSGFGFVHPPVQSWRNDRTIHVFPRSRSMKFGCLVLFRRYFLWFLLFLESVVLPRWLFATRLSKCFFCKLT